MNLTAQADLCQFWQGSYYNRFSLGKPLRLWWTASQRWYNDSRDGRCIILVHYWSTLLLWQKSLSLFTREWYLKFTLLDWQTYVTFFIMSDRHLSKGYLSHGRYLSCNIRHLQINYTLSYCQVTPTSTAAFIEPGSKKPQIEERGSGGLIGAAVGSILLAVAVFLILLICWRKRRAR